MLLDFLQTNPFPPAINPDWRTDCNSGEPHMLVVLTPLVYKIHVSRSLNSHRVDKSEQTRPEPKDDSPTLACISITLTFRAHVALSWSYVFLRLVVTPNVCPRLFESLTTSTSGALGRHHIVSTTKRPSPRFSKIKTKSSQKTAKPLYSFQKKKNPQLSKLQ